MRIFVLTGAGISAESGVATFRDAHGLWENHDIMDVATPEGFVRNPALVQRFYDARRAQLATVAPNAAHAALARLQRELPGDVTLVTQNVDDLHERAGGDPLHMHGELLKARCTARCTTEGNAMRWTGPLTGAACPECGARLRPHIVWFGEMPMRLDEIDAALEACDVFAAIGTSGEVYPAAGYVELARRIGARTVEINLEPSGGPGFDDVRIGPATREVPAWVDDMLTGTGPTGTRQTVS